MQPHHSIVQQPAVVDVDLISCLKLAQLVGFHFSLCAQSALLCHAVAPEMCTRGLRVGPAGLLATLKQKRDDLLLRRACVLRVGELFRGNAGRQRALHQL